VPARVLGERYEQPEPPGPPAQTEAPAQSEPRAQA
jgi:hypothetical protein